MDQNVWIAFASLASTAISAIAAALSGVAIARINATKQDVEKVHRAASDARDFSAPTANGYAEESRSAWMRIEKQLSELTARQVRTNSWLTRHLADHAQADIQHDSGAD